MGDLWLPDNRFYAPRQISDARPFGNLQINRNNIFGAVTKLFWVRGNNDITKRYRFAASGGITVPFVGDGQLETNGSYGAGHNVTPLIEFPDGVDFSIFVCATSRTVQSTARTLFSIGQTGDNSILMVNFSTSGWLVTIEGSTSDQVTGSASGTAPTEGVPYVFGLTANLSETMEGKKYFNGVQVGSTMDWGIISGYIGGDGYSEIGNLNTVTSPGCETTFHWIAMHEGAAWPPELMHRFTFSPFESVMAA